MKYKDKCIDCGRNCWVLIACEEDYFSRICAYFGI